MATRTYSFQDNTVVVTLPTFDGISSRIQEVIQHYGGKLPVEHALVWEGYIAALLESQLISMGDHAKLFDLISKITRTPVAPALMIFLGAEGAAETIEREGLKNSPQIST